MRVLLLRMILNKNNRTGVNIMKYMADTIVNYILGEAKRYTGVLRFVMPSYPSDLLLAIGSGLEEQFRRILERRVVLKYGIAYRLGKEWSVIGTDTDRWSFDKIKKRVGIMKMITLPV